MSLPIYHERPLSELERMRRLALWIARCVIGALIVGLLAIAVFGGAK